MKGKTILIIGNGFDLAHGLPTGYMHFLDFCEHINAIYDNTNHKGKEYYEKYLDNWDFNIDIKEEIRQAFLEQVKYKETVEYIKSTNKYIQEIRECLLGNIWYYYFYNLNKDSLLRGIKWIDFESEIGAVIKFIDNYSENLSIQCDELFEKMILCQKDNERKQLNVLGNLCKNMYKEKECTLFDLRERWYQDLEHLIRALEIYLSHFVEKISLDNRKINYIDEIHPDFVLTFNYTNTYEKLYHKNEEILYIHGRCDQDRAIDENNMVLGIDEYWNDKECDEHNNYAVFKKFIQRIRKKTGTNHCYYINAIEKIYSSSGETWSGNVDRRKTISDRTSSVFVFGHSLDRTDRDILEGFIGSDATAVKIFCKDKSTEGELVAKLIKLIGEKKLIRKANNEPPKIELINIEKILLN